MSKVVMIRRAAVGAALALAMVGLIELAYRHPRGWWDVGLAALVLVPEAVRSARRPDVDDDGDPVQLPRGMWLKYVGMLVVFAIGGVSAIVAGALARPVNALYIACGVGILLCFLALLSGATITQWRRHHEDCS